jgi:hypothetical protein
MLRVLNGTVNSVPHRGNRGLSGPAARRRRSAQAGEDQVQVRHVDRPVLPRHRQFTPQIFSTGGIRRRRIQGLVSAAISTSITGTFTHSDMPARIRALSFLGAFLASVGELIADLPPGRDPRCTRKSLKPLCLFPNGALIDLSATAWTLCVDHISPGIIGSVRSLNR